MLHDAIFLVFPHLPAALQTFIVRLAFAFGSTGIYSFAWNLADYADGHISDALMLMVERGGVR